MTQAQRAVGEIEWVIAKLKTHAEMGAGRPVNEATLRLMPSVEQCQQLAERLGAALVELQDKRAKSAQRASRKHWTIYEQCSPGLTARHKKRSLPKSSPTSPMLTVANPQRVPKEIAVCPECGGGLWWQFTTEDWLRDMHLDCEDDDWEDEDSGHRNWQSDWQPVFEKVRRWVAARLPNGALCGGSEPPQTPKLK